MARDAAAILASSSPLFRSVCRPHHRQRFTRHPVAPSGRDGRPPRPLLGDVIDTERTATNRGAAPRRSAILTDSCLRPAACCFFSSSSFSRSSLSPDLFRSLLPDVLPDILPASSPSSPSGGEGRRSPPAHPADPLHPCRGASA